MGLFATYRTLSGIRLKQQPDNWWYCEVPGTCSVCSSTASTTVVLLIILTLFYYYRYCTCCIFGGGSCVGETVNYYLFLGDLALTAQHSTVKYKSHITSISVNPRTADSSTINDSMCCSPLFVEVCLLFCSDRYISALSKDASLLAHSTIDCRPATRMHNSAALLGDHR